MSALLQPVQEIKAKASEYWFSISVRERQLLGLAGCLLIIWTVYFGIIQPIQNYVEIGQQRLTNSQKQYNQVINKAEQIVVSQGAGSTNRIFVGSQSLDILVNRTAGQAGIKITGLNRQQDSLQIRLMPVSFSTLISWLISLEEQGVDVSTLQIARTEKPGIVEIQQLRVKKEVL